MTFMMTIDVLNALGVCGTYSNRFRELFPESDERYADGVELTPEICAEHVDAFDWGWAYEVMLNRNGQREYQTLTNGNSDVMTELAADERKMRERHRRAMRTWREKYNQSDSYPSYDCSPEGNEAYHALQEKQREEVNALERKRRTHTATSFAQLVARTEYRSTNLVTALTNAESRREQREREELTRAEANVANVRDSITHLRQTIERHERDIAHHEEQLPTLERALNDARVTFHQNVLRRAERRLPTLQERYEDAKKAALAAFEEQQRQVQAQIDEARRVVDQAAATVETTDAATETTDDTATETVEA